MHAALLMSLELPPHDQLYNWSRSRLERIRSSLAVEDGSRSDEAVGPICAPRRPRPRRGLQDAREAVRLVCIGLLYV